MIPIEHRLKRCFAAVFPTLTEDQIPGASLDTVPEWDSVAHLTLVQTIEEEFHAGISDEDEEVIELTSFAAWLERLEGGEIGIGAYGG